MLERARVGSGNSGICVHTHSRWQWRAIVWRQSVPVLLRSGCLRPSMFATGLAQHPRHHRLDVAHSIEQGAWPELFVAFAVGRISSRPHMCPLPGLRYISGWRTDRGAGDKLTRMTRGAIRIANGPLSCTGHMCALQRVNNKWAFGGPIAVGIVPSGVREGLRRPPLVVRACALQVALAAVAPTAFSQPCRS